MPLPPLYARAVAFAAIAALLQFGAPRGGLSHSGVAAFAHAPVASSPTPPAARPPTGLLARALERALQPPAVRRIKACATRRVELRAAATPEPQSPYARLFSPLMAPPLRPRSGKFHISQHIEEAEEETVTVPVPVPPKPTRAEALENRRKNFQLKNITNTLHQVRRMPRPLREPTHQQIWRLERRVVTLEKALEELCGLVNSDDLQFLERQASYMGPVYFDTAFNATRTPKHLRTHVYSVMQRYGFNVRPFPNLWHPVVNTTNTK